MRKCIAEFAAFVDGTRGFRRDVTGNAAGKGKLGEQFFHPRFVPGNVRIHLAVSALQIGVGHQTRSAMSGAGDINNAQVILFDNPVEVDIDKVQTRRGTPVPEQARLYMLQLQRFFEQGVVVQINLADRQVVGGAPIGIHLAQQIRRQGFVPELRLFHLHNHVYFPFQW